MVTTSMVRETALTWLYYPNTLEEFMNADNELTRERRMGIDYCSGKLCTNCWPSLLVQSYNSEAFPMLHFNLEKLWAKFMLRYSQKDVVFEFSRRFPFLKTNVLGQNAVFLNYYKGQNDMACCWTYRTGYLSSMKIGKRTTFERTAKTLDIKRL